MNLSRKLKFYHLITYGCQANERDSETLAGFLDGLGYQPTNDLAEADVILINTCCIRQSAENKVYGKIGELKQYKQRKPELLIGVCGCMVQQPQTAEKLVKRAPHLSLLLGTHNLHQLPELLKQAEHSPKTLWAVWPQERELVEQLPVQRAPGVRAYVNIMYGCDNYCSYCIVPYVRGRERSREPEAVFAEVQTAVESGYSEIMLLGQNVNAYGKSLANGYNFAQLLLDLDQIPRVQRIRYMTSHPKDFSSNTVRAIAQTRHVCEHFHLPLQAGSDVLLRAMNRGYTLDQYRKLVQQIRESIPHCSITTDFIVGFPGETVQDFQQTLAFIEEIRFDAAYTFAYSPRSGTKAANLPDRVEPEQKKQRLQQLMEVQNQIGWELNQQFLGQQVEILVEGPSKNNPERLTGRTRTNKIVIIQDHGEYPGQLIRAEITEAQSWHLVGQREDRIVP